MSWPLFERWRRRTVMWWGMPALAASFSLPQRTRRGARETPASAATASAAATTLPFAPSTSTWWRRRGRRWCWGCLVLLPLTAFHVAFRASMSRTRPRPWAASTRCTEKKLKGGKYVLDRCSATRLPSTCAASLRCATPRATPSSSSKCLASWPPAGSTRFHPCHMLSLLRDQKLDWVLLRSILSSETWKGRMWGPSRRPPPTWARSSSPTATASTLSSPPTAPLRWRPPFLALFSSSTSSSTRTSCGDFAMIPGYPDFSKLHCCKLVEKHPTVCWNWNKLWNCEMFFHSGWHSNYLLVLNIHCIEKIWSEKPKPWNTRVVLY